MYTDPTHVRAENPGHVEGNVVFTYLDAFDENKQEVEDLKRQYRQGGLGDTLVKQRLETILQQLLSPIRERREQLGKDPDYVMDILRYGTQQADQITKGTLGEVKEALGLFSFA